MVTSQSPNMTDYEAERRSFHLEVPEYFNFAIDIINKWANDPNKLAMLWVGPNGCHCTTHRLIVSERAPQLSIDSRRERPYKQSCPSSSHLPARSASLGSLSREAEPL